jgi:DtxR family transcriptional regulator, Mn-dependent transcriptional regulator
MLRPGLSQREAIYLVELMKMQGRARTGTRALAERFGVREASVVDVVRRLEEKGLLLRDPWRSVRLTRRGEALAERILHNHRVVETYLHRVLKLGEGPACREAQKIDYLLENDTIISMCSVLNYPSQCIHGEEIRHDWCRGRKRA